MINMSPKRAIREFINHKNAVFNLFRLKTVAKNDNAEAIQGKIKFKKNMILFEGLSVVQ